MKTLYLIRGLPGSGKSTLAKKLIDGQSGFHIEADMWYYVVYGKYQWSGADVPKAHGWCQKCTRDAMINFTPIVIVSNTFTRRSEMEPYREMARELGYQVVTLTVEADLSDEQLSQRTIHNVPMESIKKMRERWETL